MDHQIRQYYTDSNIVSKPSQNISYPIHVYMINVLPFHKEAFECINDKFILLDKLPDSDYEIVSMYGDTGHYHAINGNITFPYLRQLYGMNYPMTDKRIYISRKGNVNNHSARRRCVLNETDLIQLLSKYNFETIYLEDYHFKDKIRIFQESSIVLSTHGSQHTFAIFSHNTSKIVELCNRGTQLFPNSQIRNICEVLNIPFYRYSNIIEDCNGNFTLNLDSFEVYLKTLL